MPGTLSRSGATLMLFACVVLTSAAIIGLTLYYTLPPIGGVARKDAVVDCIPENDRSIVTEDLCNQRGCTWTEPSDGAPWCTFPSETGYLLVGDPEGTDLGYKFQLERTSTPSLFGDDINRVDLYVEFHSEHRLRIRIIDPSNERFEVPEEAVNITIPSIALPDEQNRLYNIEWENNPQFGLVITRKSNNIIVFDSRLPGFTYSDQFLQLTTRLPSSHLYGLGEHNHKQFKHDMQWRNWSIFTRDVAPVDDWNLYGAQPMYMNLDEDGNANAVLLLNSNAMDIVLQPDPFPAVSFKTIGGILDFYIFLGPTPENIVQQYTEATGRPVMVPYWSLGFQLSRWDYNNITHVKHIVQRNQDAGIPQDVQYGDIDIMESKHDFTYDYVKYAGLPEWVDQLKSSGIKYIAIQDNFIGANMTIINTTFNGTYRPYMEGIRDGIFIMDPRYPDQELLGEVWPGVSVYPDFTLGNVTKDWWKRQCEDFYYNWDIRYDALWIDMNEPSNFQQGSLSGCDSNKYNYPPYVPNILGAADNNGMIFDKTICMDAPQEWGSHYDVHSLYGHSHSIASYQALKELFPDKRPLVLTRSNFVGTQKYAMHWLGDNQSLWPHLGWSIIGMLEYSIFGFSYTGADICGFWYAATEEMCQRWMQLGAFYPYARNHNGETWPDQDPAAFSPAMIASSRDILMTRYKLLPYLYTLMHQAHAFGNTVVRPLMHEFTNDKNTWSIDTQFLWGPSLMISPALNQGQTSVQAYFPQGRWYNYYGGLEVQNTGSIHNLTTPLDKINLHVRGGYIIPWQEPALNTLQSRQNPLGLLVALGPAPNYEASGSLFWDDGESPDTYEKEEYIEFQISCSQNFLRIDKVKNGFTSILEFDTIDIYGLERRIESVKIDNTDVPLVVIEYDAFTKVAKLRNLHLAFNTGNHTVEWIYEN